jgi:hypothetical protein
MQGDANQRPHLRLLQGCMPAFEVPVIAAAAGMRLPGERGQSAVRRLPDWRHSVAKVNIPRTRNAELAPRHSAVRSLLHS